MRTTNTLPYTYLNSITIGSVKLNCFDVNGFVCSGILYHSIYHVLDIVQRAKMKQDLTRSRTNIIIIARGGANISSVLHVAAGEKAIERERSAESEREAV